MKNKDTMGSKWTHFISCLYFLVCYTVRSFTSSILPPSGLSIASTANDAIAIDRTNSSLELDHGATKIGHLIANESTTADVLLHQSNISPDSKVNGNPSKDLLDEDEYVYTFTNITATSNLTTLNLPNSTHYKIWHHLLNFPNNVICHFYQGDGYIKKDPEVKKTYFGGYKLLAMFLAMAGVLACLLILIYCIYIRQHKEEMFSHHRLYGEGFEDPVLHLDTPVDHLDFFSFRDTELTPAPTPQHKCHKTETYETNGDYRVEAPKGISTNDYLHQMIHMGSIKQ
ncbi:Golgi-associated olfactory signaling regulator [Ranitomeya imitator]|uniref:Golgi-associated olfactory signaling regulator n=1 Tax=Ranitomeya imitator TaxID=111125 RepID=UPI0037E7F0BE